MSFQVQFRHSKGNLHIKASGGFDGNAAEKLLELFSSEYPEGGRVFIDTEGVGDVHPSGRAVLGSGLVETSVPATALFFMGDKGFQMAPDGTRVLTFNRERTEKRKVEGHRKTMEGEHRCCGRCAHCTCKHGHGGHG